MKNTSSPSPLSHTTSHQKPTVKRGRGGGGLGFAFGKPKSEREEEKRTKFDPGCFITSAEKNPLFSGPKNPPLFLFISQRGGRLPVAVKISPSSLFRLTSKNGSHREGLSLTPNQRQRRIFNDLPTWSRAAASSAMKNWLQFFSTSLLRDSKRCPKNFLPCELFRSISLGVKMRPFAYLFTLFFYPFVPSVL